MKKIMIVEDDKIMCDELAKLLSNNNFDPIILHDFSNSLNEILKCLPDLILLDINIPFMNGEMLLKELRKKSNIPVIMLTSSNSEIDEALSISFGADDYISKPFNSNILLLRIGAILRRMEVPVNLITYKDLRINLTKCTLNNNGIEIELTKNEMIVFRYLLNHKNKIVTRDELMTDLWNNNEFINDNALTVNISRLRSKLKSINCNGYIKTRKGMGYILS